jgi:hypothetical protein
MVAEMAAWAIEQHPVDAVIAAGLREAEQLAQQHALRPATLQPLRRAARGDWPPNTAEPTLDAFTTVASVLSVFRETIGLATAMKHAVALGGDTDTTAAIVGGILGCQLEDVGGQIPWHLVSACLMPGLSKQQRQGRMNSGERRTSSLSALICEVVGQNFRCRPVDFVARRSSYCATIC